MKIVRHVRPNGAPILVQSQIDDNGEVIKETVRMFPIINKNGIPYVGQELPIAPLSGGCCPHPPTI